MHSKKYLSVCQTLCKKMFHTIPRARFPVPIQSMEYWKHFTLRQISASPFLAIICQWRGIPPKSKTTKKQIFFNLLEQKRRKVPWMGKWCFLVSTFYENDKKWADMEFVKNFTPSDFQVRNFTPAFSPNFNSFSKKKHKKWVKMEKFTSLGKIFYTVNFT